MKVSGAYSNLSQVLIRFGVDDVRYLGLAITDQLDIPGLVWIRKSKVTADSITFSIGLKSTKLDYPFTETQLVAALMSLAEK